MKILGFRRAAWSAATLAAFSFLTTPAFVQSGFAQSGVTGVWAVDDGEKVRRDDVDHWAASSPDNAVWDGSTIRIFGARNEIVAFQLILQARGSGASGVDVALDSLVGPGSIIANRPTTDDPFDYRGRHIELFLEHYINVTQRSACGTIACWCDACPIPDSAFMGWIPDALVPFQATPGTAEWIGGAPFAIGRGRNQGVWVDITIPRDAPPGTYRATVRVTEQGVVSHSIPLELLVYNFTLPDSTHFHNTFYIDKQLLTRHPGITTGSDAYWQMFQKYMHLAHRHRMDLTDGRMKLNAFDAKLRDYYTGARYTEQFGYGGPGLGVGNTTYSIGTYDQPDDGYISGFGPPTRQVWQDSSDAWESWFRANAPDVVRFKYMVDEPGRDTTQFYPVIRERAAWIHENPGPGRDLPVFCTVKFDPRLVGSVDFWSLTGQSGTDPGDGILLGYRIQKANQRRAFGERAGIYNGTRPSFGIFEWIDNVATDPRVDAWIAFKYNVDQFFLWETGQIYNQTSQEKQDPWLTPYQTYPGGKVKWGHGTVLYTGNDALFPDESRGIDGPIASIRIKNWRRGQQDYEYLTLARQAGVAEDLLDGVVSAAFDDYKYNYTSASAQPVFAQRGFVFELARRRLADRIDRGSKANLVITVANNAGWEEIDGEGMVYLYDWRQQLVDSCQTLGSGYAMFVDVPPDTGYSYQVYRTSRSGDRPLGTEYWGGRRGLTIQVGDIVSEQFTRNMPRTSKIRLYDQLTGQNMTGGVVTPGTALRLTVEVSNPSDLGADGQSVKARAVLDQDMNPPFDSDCIDSAFQTIEAGGKELRTFHFTPTVEGDYYGVTATMTEIGGSPVCTQSGKWTDTLLHVAAKLPAPALVYPADSATGVEQNPMLTWRRTDYVTGYRLIVSPDSLFANAVTDTAIADTMVALPLLQPLTEYRWKVASTGFAGQGPFSPSWTFTTGEWLSVHERRIPLEFTLAQNYPNPFNPSTTIRYGLPSRSHVTIAVFNMLGQLVATLVPGEQEAGYHDVQFEAGRLASGIYLYRLTAGDFVQTKKLAVVR